MITRRYALCPRLFSMEFPSTGLSKIALQIISHPSSTSFLHSSNGFMPSNSGHVNPPCVPDVRSV
eukprot:6229794-Amphidinium_carterae.1